MNGKPYLTEQFDKMLEAAGLLHRDLVNRQVFRGCFNCEYMDKKASICSKFQCSPPVEIVTFSCGKEWLGEIPF